MGPLNHPPLFLLLLLTISVPASFQRNYNPPYPYYDSSSSNQSPQRLPTIDTKFGIKYDEALDAIFNIAIRLEALLSETSLKNSKNFMVSPLSMAVAVGELMLGANGPFVEQLHELLTVNNTHTNYNSNPNDNSNSGVRHLGDDENLHSSLHQQLGDLMQNLENDRSNNYKLRTSSIMFVQKGLKVKDRFRRDIERYYGTKIQELGFYNDPFGALRIINSWCNKATNGLIRELSSTPFPSTTAAILANAVYFKADWEVPFSNEVNKRGPFKISRQETVNVTYMIGEFENYRYVENLELGCRMVTIPYVENEVFMYIILPNPTSKGDFDEYDINSFTKKLRNADLQKMISESQERKVTMVLPKMKLSNTINMLEPLKKYQNWKTNEAMRNRTRNRGDITGIEDEVNRFSNSNMQNSGLESSLGSDSGYGSGSGMGSRLGSGKVRFDLSNMSDDPRFAINNLYQQMTLSVNEKGTEAAAISAGIVDYIMDSVVFRVDRPFLFFIQHDNTKATLFWGTIVDPTEEN